jgi:hypothetical protein
MDGRYEIANGGRLFFDDGLHELAGALHTRIVRGRLEVTGHDEVRLDLKRQDTSAAVSSLSITLD